MQIFTKLGCLQNAERMPTHPLYGSTTVQWREDYAVVKIGMELPPTGSKVATFPCPICERGVTLRLSALSNIQMQLVLALLFIGAVIGSLGYGIYAAIPDEFLQQAGLIVLGLGGLIALAGLVVGVVDPGWVWRLGHNVAIIRDEVRNHEQGPGFAGMRGHKILEVWPIRQQSGAAGDQ